MKKSSAPYGAASRAFTNGFTLEFRAQEIALGGESINTLHFERDWLDHFAPVVRAESPRAARLFR